MSSYYGVIFPEFWTGRTGRELRERGGKDAQILGLYLASNRHANMIGLYRLMVDDVRHETGLGIKALQRAYSATTTTAFAYFDADSSFVWVKQMARIRLGLKAGVALEPGDNKVVAVNRLYAALDSNPFLGEFFDMNHSLLRLRKRRESVGVVASLMEDHKMSPLEGAYQGASKPGSEISISNQDQLTDQAPKEPDAQPTRKAFDHYHARFIKYYGGKPTIAGGKDGKRMKDLLNVEGLDEVRRRIDGFFDSTDSWVQTTGHTLDVFFAAGTQTKLVAHRHGVPKQIPQESAETKAYRAWKEHGCPHTPQCPHFAACRVVSARGRDL